MFERSNTLRRVSASMKGNELREPKTLCSRSSCNSDGNRKSGRPRRSYRLISWRVRLPSSAAAGVPTARIRSRQPPRSISSPGSIGSRIGRVARLIRFNPAWTFGDPRRSDCRPMASSIGNLTKLSLTSPPNLTRLSLTSGALTRLSLTSGNLTRLSLTNPAFWIVGSAACAAGEPDCTGTLETGIDSGSITLSETW